jgi:HEAT repeat protein/type 1 glutamine amidotransferase
MKKDANMTKQKIKLLTAALAFFWLFSQVLSRAPAGQDTAQFIKALIITGQNNHDWKTSSAALKQILEDTGLFQVDLAVSPPAGASLKNFSPRFSSYKLVVLDYNGDLWPPATRKSFVEFVKSGGGVVVYHSADNAFAGWPEYNEIIGLAGWGNRDEKAGPYVFWKEGQVSEDASPGIAGYHTPPHEFLVLNRDASHPITAGLPPKWMHAEDELYGLLRGPAKNLHPLATAYSAPEQSGTGRDEPVLFTVGYGAGRIFHTTLGHAGSDGPPRALECVGFIVTFQRGAEWAATGSVTQKIPGDFPATDLDTSTPADVRRWPGFRPPSLEAILNELASFEYSRDEAVLYRLREYILTHKNPPESRANCEEALIGFLGSEANLYAKMAVCRQLRLIGTEKSMPVLAQMLVQDETTDLARYALEKIPGASAERVLLDALEKTQGQAKIGLISSLGQRKSKEAVPALGHLIDDQDKAIAAAAVVSLGQIGDSQAAAILAAALDKPEDEAKATIASALLKCAGELLAQKKEKEAAGLYEKILTAKLSLVQRQAAMAGKIASAGKHEAAQIIMDTLSRGPEEMQAPAIGLIREVFDASTIGPVCSLLPKLPEASQVQLLSALSGYSKEAVLPSLMNAARSPLPDVRIAALNALSKTGDASSVAFLAERAAGTRGAEQETARTSLYTLRGEDVDEAVLFNLISQADEATKNELIRAIGERRIYAGKSLLLGQTLSQSSDNRLQAIKSLKAVASPEDLPALSARLLDIEDEFGQEEMENTIAGIAQNISQAYSQAVAVEDMLEPRNEAVQKKVRDVKKRYVLYRVLGKIGEDSSLPLLRAALKDENPEIVDAAIRAFADWPNVTPREDVFAIAKNASNLTHKVLALQAYVRMISLEPYQSPEGAVLKLQEVLSLSPRPEEKKLVLGALPTFACPEALQLAASLLADEAVKAEAQAAVDQIKEKLGQGDQKS